MVPPSSVPASSVMVCSEASSISAARITVVPVGICAGSSAAFETVTVRASGAADTGAGACAAVSPSAKVAVGRPCTRSALQLSATIHRRAVRIGCAM